VRWLLYQLPYRIVNFGAVKLSAASALTANFPPVFSNARVRIQPTEEEQKHMGTFGRFMSRGECPVPIIGAAQATALAGGFELLLSCDLIVAAEGSQVGLPEVKRGLFAAGGGMFLARRIPLARALELTLTGDRDQIRSASVLAVLTLLERALENLCDGVGASGYR